MENELLDYEEKEQRRNLEMRIRFFLDKLTIDELKEVLRTVEFEVARKDSIGNNMDF